jgi:hypothetical protein
MKEKNRCNFKPSFAETRDEMNSQDENSTQGGNRGPNQIFHLNWSSGEFLQQI